LQVELSLIKICHIPSALNLSTSASAEALKKKPDSAVKTENSSTPTPVLSPQIEAQKEVQVLSTPPIPSAVITEQEESIPPPPIPQEKLKISVQPLKSVPSIIPNLNDLSGNSVKAEEDEPKYVSGDSRKPFDADEFLKLWNDYAAVIKKAGKINLFTIMTGNPPTLLGDSKIELVIDNRIQEELLMVEKIDLLNFLRVRLENFGIDIITRKAEQNEKKKLYTSHEKYQHMLSKNPKLEEFRRKFNLDVN
jgi:DNA polymerase-3 subunit gamma/tau